RTYAVDGIEIDHDQLLELYISLQEKFPLKSIEDPFHDEDFENFSRITKKLGAKLQIVGDDLFVTNIKRVAQGIRVKAANALLVKINQIGTLTETIEAVETARKADYGLVLSHRSGETEDNSIADISVAWQRVKSRLALQPEERGPPSTIAFNWSKRNWAPRQDSTALNS